MFDQTGALKEENERLAIYNKLTANASDRAKSWGLQIANNTKTLADFKKENEVDDSLLKKQFSIKDSFKSFGASALSMIGNTILQAGVGMLVGTGIELAMKGISAWIHRDENRINKGNEASDNIIEQTKAYNEQRTTLKALAGEYTKLANGVRISGNEIKNLSLSDTEYESFLNTCNEIANVAPSLVQSYDSQGNAILNLGKNTDGINKKIEDYITLQRDLTHISTKESIRDQYKGIVTEAKNLEEDLSILETQYKNASEAYNNLEQFKNAFDTDKDGFVVTESALIKLQELYDDAEHIPWTLDSQAVGYYKVNFNLQEISDSEKDRISTFIEDQVNQARIEFTTPQAEYQAQKLLIDSNWKELVPTLQSYIDSSNLFDSLEDTHAELVKSNLKTMITNIDYSTIADEVEAAGTIDKWIDQQLIAPMVTGSEEVKKAWTGLFELEDSRAEISISEFAEERDKFLEVIAQSQGVTKSEMAARLGYATRNEDGSYNWTIRDEIDRAAARTGIARSGEGSIGEYLNNLTQKDYDIAIDLILNGEKAFASIVEIENALKDAKNSAKELEEQETHSLSAMQDMINTSKSALSSYSSIMSESQSEGGISIESINLLKSQFASLIEEVDSLKGYDLNALFFNTADGVKLNADELERLVDIQHELEVSKLAKAIELQKKSINDLDSSSENYTETLTGMQDKLSELYQAQAQNMALYNQQKELFSDYYKIEIAEQTPNAGDNYVGMLSKFKTATEAYNKGLIGTDDFKTVAAYLSPTGSDDPTNFAENYAKAVRYLTEDETGVKNFLNDLESKGLAEFNEETERWTSNIKDMYDAAQQMGMGEQFMRDMFGRLEDYGFSNNFVDSVDEGVQKISSLYGKLAQEEAKLAEMESLGYDETNKTAIDAQREKVQGLRSDIEETKNAMEQLVTYSAEDYNRQVESAKTAMETLAEERQKILETKVYGDNTASIVAMMDEEIRKLGEAYQIDVTPYLSGGELAPENNELILDPTVKKALLNFENKDEYIEEIQDKLADEVPVVEPALQMNEDDLKNAKQQTKETFEEEPIEQPIDIVTTTDIPTAHNILLSILRGETVQIPVSIAQEEQAYSALEMIRQRLYETTKKGLEFNVFDEELLYYADLIASLPEEKQIEFGVKKFNLSDSTNILLQLMNNPNSINIPISGETNAFIEAINSAVSYTEEQEPTVSVGGSTSGLISAADDGVRQVNRKGALIKIDGDTNNLFKTISDAISTIQNTAVNIVVNFIGSLKSFLGLYTGTMTSVASHANGTVPYNVLNTTPAYANGKISLPKDETALVNEIGQESYIRNGEWHLLPPGMHFENLKKGDIILNHLQTKSLIEQGRALGKGHVRGYTNGTLLSSAYGGGTSSGKFQGGLSGNKLGAGSNTGSSKTTANNAAKTAAKAAETAEDLVDWIETLLTRLQTATDGFIQAAENSIKLSTALNNYQSAIDNMSTQITANQSGATRYKAQADAVDLSEDIKKLVREGKVDINAYDEATREKITDYTQWFEKSQECLQNIADLQQQMIEVAQSKLDAIIDKYNLRVEYQDAYLDRYDAQLNYRETAGYSDTSSKQKEIYNASIEKEMNKISYYEQAAATLYNEMNAQLSSGLMTKGDDRWRETQNQLQEYNSSLYESKTSIEEWNQALRAINTNKLQDALDRFTRWANQLASIIGLSEARDENISESTYKKQITANNNQIYYQDKLLAEYLAEQAKYEYGSEKWNEYADKIADCKNETLSLLETNEKLKDSIVEERWETFNLLQDEVDNSITEIDYLRDALNSSVNSAGELTSDGYANIALIGKAITLENQTIADYTEALKKLDKEYANGNISQKEYNEKQEEFLGVIRDSASSVQDYKDELLDLYKEQIEAQNEVLTDNIDMYKQAYESQKDYFEYGETLKEQTKTVDALEAQIQALNGVTNAAGKARLAQLKAQQAEAKEALDKTKREHEYELKISGFDGLKENVQSQLEAVQNELEINSEMQQKVVDTMLLNIQNNYSSAYSTIQSTISSTGVVMSNMTNNAINEWTKLSKVMKLTAKAMSEVADYDPSKTATSIKTSQIVTNKTSMTDSKGNTVTTDQAEANAIRNDNGKTNAANLGNSYSTALVKATSLSLNKSSLSLTVGKSSTLTVKLAPENAASNLTWKTSSSKIATVSNGKVTAVKKGSATITVTDSYSGKSAKCKVTVKDKTSSSSTNNSNTSNTTTNNSTKNIWSGISTDTSEKGNSNLDRNVSIIDRMKYFGYASDNTARTQLFKNLGGSGSYTGSATQNAWMLEQLKKAGYSSGGIVGYSSVNVGDILQKAMISTGDNGLAFLTAGETVMPTKFTELLPQGLKILEEVAKVNTPDISAVKQPIVVNTELNFKIDQITNDIDLNAFANQMKKDIPKYITNEIRRLR